jgi:enoyl-CoA hydratase/carnithine racemase
MSGSLVIAESEGVLCVTLNRPAKRNAIDLDMWEGLVSATSRFRENDDLRALLIRATGPYFSAGIDLHSALAPDPALASPSAFRRWYRQGIGSLHGLGDEWEAIEKPITFAIDGPCLGGAMELALCADFRLATSEARFGLPEIALGGIPGSGGTSRLVRLAGPHWARWMILANRQVPAEQALSIGLVHDIMPREGFEAAALAFCREIGALPKEGFAAGKLAIELAADLDRAQARNVERLAVSGLVQGDEYKTMMAAMQARLAAKGKA